MVLGFIKNIKDHAKKIYEYLFCVHLEKKTSKVQFKPFSSNIHKQINEQCAITAGINEQASILNGQ